MRGWASWNCQKGMSLLEVLVATAIGVIIGYGVAASLANQAREASALQDKLAALDFQNSLTATLAKPGLCDRLFKNATFNGSLVGSTPGPSIPITRIYLNASPTDNTLLAQVNQLVSGLSNRLRVGSIRLTNFVGSGDSFTADLVVDFSPGLVRAIRPAATKITMTTTGGPTETIDTCSSVAKQQLVCRRISASGDASTYGNTDVTCAPDEQMTQCITTITGSGASQCFNGTPAANLLGASCLAHCNSPTGYAQGCATTGCTNWSVAAICCKF